MIDSIDQWGNAFVDDGIHLCAKPVEDHTKALTVAEHSVVADSIAIRKNTYSTGRLCAKLALKNLGVSPNTYAEGLLRQQDGSVGWPADVIGSISHTDDWAVAAVAASNNKWQSIGIDIEHIDRVGKNVLRTIATDHEFFELESNAHLRWARVALFSVKESLYKCLRPIYGEFITFKDVQLRELNTAATFENALPINSQNVEFYSPKVELLLPKLANCCDAQKIEVRLAVLPSHVVSFVSIQRLTP